MHCARDRSAELLALIARRRPRASPAATLKPLSNRDVAFQHFFTALADQSLPLLRARDAYDVARNVCEAAALEAHNDSAQLHWCEASRLVQTRFNKYVHERRKLHAPLAAKTGKRADALEEIQLKLEVVASLTDVVREHVLHQMPLVDSVERNAETMLARIDAARRELEDAAPRAYNSVRRTWLAALLPQTFGARVRFCITVLILCNVLLISCGVI